MLELIGFWLLVLVLYLVIYRTTQAQRERWMKTLIAWTLLAGLFGLLWEVWLRGGRLPI